MMAALSSINRETRWPRAKRCRHLKNALTGANLPTLTDLFSGKPQVPGASATSTPMMNVTATVVNLNGGLPGIPALPGANTGGLAGLIGASTPANPLGANYVRPGLPLAANSNVPTTDVAAYIRQAAIARGIDPNTALAVARSEGGLTSWNQQSYYVNPATGLREQSYGPYQLYMNGGLGNQFQSKTGLDPRLAQNGPEGVDFALDYAKQNGWSSWYGADKAGISKWQGINPGQNLAIDPMTTNSVAQNMAKLSSTTSSAAKDISSLGDNSLDAGKSIMDAFKAPAGQPNIPSNYFPPAPQMGANYFPPAPTSGLSFGGIFQSLFKGIFGLFGFADGTDFSPGGLAMVGERGRELVNLPRGSQVIPNHRTESLMSGRGQGKVEMTHNYNITVSGNGDKELMARMHAAAEESVQASMATYDREVLFGRIDEYQRDKYARG